MTGKEVIDYIYANSLLDKQVLLPRDEECTKEYLTTKQLANKLGVKEGTIRVWVARGKLPTGIRVGGQHFFLKETETPKRR